MGRTNNKGELLFPKNILRPPNRRIGYNSISIGQKSEILVLKGIFGVSQFHSVIQTFSLPTSVAMVTKIWIFEHKIGYKSVSIADTSQILVPNCGF